MKPRHEEHKLTESQAKSRKPRFQIEKPEERIAPKKGGIPGHGGDHGPDHRQGCRFGARAGDC